MSDEIVGARSKGRRRVTLLGVVGGTLLTLFLASMTVAFCVGIVGQVEVLGYRAGWEGTPVTLTHMACNHVGSGRNSTYDCIASFLPPGQTVGARVVNVEGGIDWPPGNYPGRLHDDGGASVSEARTVLPTIATMLAFLGFALIVGMLLVFLVGEQIGWLRGRPAWMGRKTPKLVIGVFGGMLAGGVLSIVLAAVLGIIGVNQ